MKTHCKFGHEFTEENTYYRKDGRGRQCRKCKLDRQMKIYWVDPQVSHDRINASRRSDNPPASYNYLNNRKAALKSMYKMTPEEYVEMLDSQGGRCAICGTTDSGYKLNTFAVDHDHACCPGKYTCGQCIRGLLCRNCNNGLGMFQDSQDYLRSATMYLDSFTQIGGSK